MGDIDNRNSPLSVEIKGGKLIVSIGVNVLAHAAACSSWATPYDDERRDYFRTFAIADAEEFAKDVRSAASAEREDGSSLVTDLLDKACEAAVNDGSLGLLYSDVSIAFDQHHECETWAATQESR